MSIRRSPATALAALLFAPLAAPAQEVYFVVVFGSQRPIFFEANHTHTFATFVRAVPCDGPAPGPGLVPVETFTLSWMPQTLEIRVGKLLPEPGVNLDLPRTLAWALNDRQRVSYWGPFQITPDLYQRALRQKAHGESGALRYKAVDTGFPTERVSNCIHFVSDLAYQAPRLRIGTATWGQAASYFVTLSLSPGLVDRRRTHDWVADYLGLGNYPLVARDLEDRNPTRRPALRATQSLLRLGLRLRLGD